jgi:RING finger protein 113A
MAAPGAKKQFRKRAHSSDDEESEIVRASANVPKKPAAVTTFTSARSGGTGDVSIVAELDAVGTHGVTSANRHGVFATSEIDTGLDRDGRALYERHMALQESARESVVAEKKLYRGVAGYSNFIQKDAAEAASRSKVTGSHGPLRAPSNVRGILRMDYAPDICKDYKETGFCGFGDSCKFLHDRGDYKMGWQIEKEYDEQQRKKAAARAARAAAGGDPDDEDADNPFLVREADADGLPFACHLCREAFRSPVQTQCGHYFCEECAVKHYATSPLCAVCGKQTHGLFNPNPVKLLAKLRATAAEVVAKDTPASEGAAAPPLQNGNRGDERSRPAVSSGGWEAVHSDDDDVKQGGDEKPKETVAASAPPAEAPASEATTSPPVA